MPKHVLITGANRGIGLAMAKQFVNRGDKVFAVCRQVSDELKSLNLEIFDQMDVSEDATLDKLTSLFSTHKIDLLVNNAGILGREELGSIDADSIRKQFEVNALAPLRLTEALLLNLNIGAKVIMITSRMGSLADNGSGAYYGYRMSKAALNCAAVSLAQDLKPKKISVAVLHPGFVQTDMVGHAGDVTAEQSAQGLIERMDELNLSNTGTFWHANGERLPW